MIEKMISRVELLTISGLIFILALLCGCTSISASEKKTDMEYTPVYKQFTGMTDEERLADAEARRRIYYRNRLELFIKELPDVKKGGTVFLGDSITQGFPISVAFQGQNVINRGIGGDIIEGVTERLDICIEALKPKQVYLMIGVNNLLWAFRAPEVYDKQFRTLLSDLHYAAPKAKVTVLSALPISGKFAENNHLIPPYNALIKGITEEFGLEYIDLHPYFTDEKGELRADLTVDGVHLNVNGYLSWLQAILGRDEFFETALNLSGSWAKKYSPTFSVTKIDPPMNGEYPGSRGSNELVIYTPAYENPTTGTNEWGTEVIVRGGTVEKVSKRDSAIPAAGFVVSGHGRAAIWIDTNLKPGVPVEYDSASIRFGTISGIEMTAEFRLGVQKERLFEYLQLITANGADKASKKKALVLLEQIQKMQLGAKAVNIAELDKLTTELDELTKL
jgi:lysophospholipase L1-like esterase